VLSGVVSDVYSPTRRRDLFAFNHRPRCIAEGRFGLHLSGSYEHSHGPVIAHNAQMNLTLGIAGNNQPVNATASQGLLDTAQTSSVVDVDHDRVQELPRSLATISILDFPGDQDGEGGIR